MKSTRGFSSLIIVAVVAVLILIAVGGFAAQKQTSDEPAEALVSQQVKSADSNDFPYEVRDGQVYCAEHLRNILVDGNLLLEEADAATFRRPTQEDRDEAFTHGPNFVIDAVDKNYFYYQCSWINFEGTV
jgi:competence protein ComGC